MLSRFLFYYIKNRAKWRRRSERDKGIDDNYFKELGKKWYSLYEKLNKSTPIQFEISESQDEKYDDFYELVYNNCPSIFGVNAEDAIARLGVATRRIAMILSTIRLIGKELPSYINCEDADIESAMIIAKVILKHDIKIYKQMYATRYKPLDGLNEQQSILYESLPNEFDWKTFLENACKLGINKKTAERYKIKLMEKGYIRSPKYNCYNKLK